jgi:hypothetical protein
MTDRAVDRIGFVGGMIVASQITFDVNIGLEFAVTDGADQAIGMKELLIHRDALWGDEIATGCTSPYKEIEIVSFAIKVCLSFKKVVVIVGLLDTAIGAY